MVMPIGILSLRGNAAAKCRQQYQNTKMEAGMDNSLPNGVKEQFR
jgi:hypothetical protein